ncbi:MAG: polysaccharide biosynthesis C-terminal domain-containing protein, partial [Chloroflexota bacterium]
MIDGVKIVRLNPHADERGYLVEILRADDPHFIRFGQVYVSTCYPGVVKAWHCHTKQTDTFFVVKGNAKIGIFDDREGSPTRGQT